MPTTTSAATARVPCRPSHASARSGAAARSRANAMISPCNADCHRGVSVARAAVVSRTRCGILHAAAQSRDRNKAQRLVRSRFCEAALREGLRAASRPGNAKNKTAHLAVGGCGLPRFARNDGRGVSALRLVVRRRRLGAVLGHEGVELFLVLGVAQAIEEVAEFDLL